MQYHQNLTLENSCKKSIFDVNKFKTIQIQKMPSQDLKVLSQYLTNSKDITGFPSHRTFKYFPNINSKEISYCKGPTGNHFFDSIYIAYVTHGELILSPDDVWVSILGPLTFYINENSEKLREKLVFNKEKIDINVKYIEKDKNFTDIHYKYFKWDYFIDLFAQEIKNKTKGDIYEIVQNNFSTTGIIEKTVSNIALMHMCQKYFNYRALCGGCGIEKVHFLGTLNDWELLLKKTKSLYYYNSNKNTRNPTIFYDWVDNLIVVIEEFINTYNGIVNISFWNGVIDEKNANEIIYSYMWISGINPIQVISGWLLSFCLYDKKENILTREYKTYHLFDDLSKKNLIGKQTSELNCGKKIFGLKIDDIPFYIFKAPITIEFLDQPEYVGVNILGGFTGVLKEGNCYRPQISIGVEQRELEDQEKQFNSLYDYFNGFNYQRNMPVYNYYGSEDSDDHDDEYDENINDGYHEEQNDDSSNEENHEDNSENNSSFYPNEERKIELNEANFDDNSDDDDYNYQNCKFPDSDSMDDWDFNEIEELDDYDDEHYEDYGYNSN